MFNPNKTQYILFQTHFDFTSYGFVNKNQNCQNQQVKMQMSMSHHDFKYFFGKSDFQSKRDAFQDSMLTFRFDQPKNYRKFADSNIYKNLSKVSQNRCLNMFYSSGSHNYTNFQFQNNILPINIQRSQKLFTSIENKDINQQQEFQIDGQNFIEIVESNQKQANEFLLKIKKQFEEQLIECFQPINKSVESNISQQIEKEIYKLQKEKNRFLDIDIQKFEKTAQTEINLMLGLKAIDENTKFLKSFVQKTKIQLTEILNENPYKQNLLSLEMQDQILKQKYEEAKKELFQQRIKYYDDLSDITAQFFDHLYNSIVLVDPKFMDPQNFPKKNQEIQILSEDQKLENQQ